MFGIRFIFKQLQTFPMRNCYTYTFRKAKELKVLTISLRLLSTDIAEADDSDKIVKELCSGDSELEKKLKILMLEVEVMRQDGRRAPENLKNSHWKCLLELNSSSQRSKYLNYLWKIEKSKENDKAKKEEKRLQRQEKTPPVKQYPDDLLYGIADQSLFLRIRDRSINNFDNYRTLRASMYGRPLVMDCSYEEYMVRRETMNAAKQMMLVFGENRLHRDPFDIHLCNLNLDGIFMEELRKFIPTLEEPWFPMHLHTQSYLDIFPKEKLVYLTPHCREELTQFDYDAVYIVGCMVDKVNSEPFSLAKAKKNGLRMAKLPLDRMMEWAPGSKKSLNINHMIPILLDLKSSGDWNHSLRHVPRRKLMETKILAMQKKIANNNALRNEVVESLRISLPKDKRHLLKRSLYEE